MDKEKKMKKLNRKVFSAIYFLAPSSYSFKNMLFLFFFLISTIETVESNFRTYKKTQKNTKKPLAVTLVLPKANLSTTVIKSTHMVLVFQGCV